MPLFKNFGLLFLLAALVFTSCRKDEETHGYFPPITVVPEVIVNGSFSGVVTDGNNEAVQGAAVSFHSGTIMTDENGYFSFRNVEINERGSLLAIEKEGYFFNAKFINSKLNQENFTSVKLIEKELTGSFPAVEGGTVTTPDGASVRFSVNTIKKENGEVYTGNVKVFATWLNPTAADLVQRMPGDLRAFNAEEEQQQLTTFGMIGVELEGESGEILNIADGQTAVIELPVPSELAAVAPATIPLWHFDETTGYWVEEGEAFLQNGKYTGTVSHFSFWNCDVPNDFVFIEGLITDRSGNPVPNITVLITETGSGTVGYGYTNSEGIYSGAVPSGQDLILSIVVNCDVEIYNEPIGPFSEDTVIPTIVATQSDIFTTIIGTFSDCDNNAVLNGYLKVVFGETTVILPIEVDGNINGIINTCGETSVNVTAFDLNNSTQSTPTTIDVAPGQILDLENIEVCDELEEYVIFTIGNIEITDNAPLCTYGPINGVPGYTFIKADNPNPTITGIFNFAVLGDAVGTYTAEYITGAYVENPPQVLALQCVGEVCDVIVEITTHEGIGGYVIGSYSGTVDPSGLGTTQTVSGTFKVLIEEG